ncbi:MAG: hypothetical protein ACTSRI_07800 [Promethearchaeota archaeon]
MKPEKIEKYKQKYNGDLNQWFYDSIDMPYIDMPFKILTKLATNDTFLNQLYYMGKGKPRKVVRKVSNRLLFDSLGRTIDKWMGLTDNFKVAMFGKEGFKHKSGLASYVGFVAKQYIIDWKRRQDNRIKIPPPIHKVAPVPNTYSGWKELREDVCPNFSLQLKKGEIFKVLPNDTITPNERIDRSIEFKDVDRIGVAPFLNHTIVLVGAQKGMGGFWDFVYEGKRVAKMTLNTWIKELLSPRASPAIV